MEKLSIEEGQRLRLLKSSGISSLRCRSIYTRPSRHVVWLLVSNSKVGKVTAARRALRARAHGAIKSHLGYMIGFGRMK